jgi:hypothetical protein
MWYKRNDLILPNKRHLKADVRQKVDLVDAVAQLGRASGEVAPGGRDRGGKINTVL